MNGVGESLQLTQCSNDAIFDNLYPPSKFQKTKNKNLIYRKKQDKQLRNK